MVAVGEGVQSVLPMGGALGDDTVLNVSEQGQRYFFLTQLIFYKSYSNYKTRNSPYRAISQELKQGSHIIQKTENKIQGFFLVTNYH